MKRYKLRIPVSVGKLETVIDEPETERRGLLLVAHPHPLHGGSLDNKVVTTLAKAANETGWISVRPNFRGVGMSDGEFDAGVGQTAAAGGGGRPRRRAGRPRRAGGAGAGGAGGRAGRGGRGRAGGGGGAE